MTVLEINGRKVEVDDSFRALSPEQQQATVEEIAQSLGQPRSSEFNMGTLNRGIAQGFGGAVDLVNAGTNAIYRRVGLPEVHEPVGGSKSLMRGMGAIGAEVAGQDAQTTTGKMVQGVGQVAGAMPTVMAPMAQAARSANALRGPSVGNTAKMITDDMVNRPVRSSASELAAGAGAAYGGDKAQELTQSNNAALRGAGEVLGGLAAGIGPYAATRATAETAKRLPLTGSAIRAIRASVVPFTRSGGFERASERLRGLSADPEGQANMLAGPTPLSPAQTTGDKRLMALERAILNTDAALSDEFEMRLSEASQNLRAALQEPYSGSDMSDTRGFIEQRREYLFELLDTRVEQARLLAEQKASKLSPKRRETANAMLLRSELDKAFEQARAQEKQLWDAVPPMAEASTRTLRQVFGEITTSTSAAQQADIPTIAKNLLGEDGLPDETTVREVRGLYSKLRQVARNARAGTAPNDNMARIADLLAEAALDDLGARANDATDVGKLINDARAYSRAMNETFGQGTVGTLRGRLQTGGDAIPPEMTLSTTIGRGGARASVAYDDMLRATGQRGQLDDSVADYLKGRFLDQAMPGGRFSGARANAFFTQNRETLDRLPALRTELEDMVRTQGAAASATASSAKSQRALSDPRRSAGAMITNARTGEEIAAIFRARNPSKAAQSVLAQARKDKTGRALGGLKGGVVDHLMQNARTGRFDDQGQIILSGRGLLGQLNDPRKAPVLRRVLTKEELGRLRRVAVQLRNAETAQGRLPSVGEPMNDAPNQMISFVSRIAAARQGARAGQGTGGGQLVIAGEFSKRIQRILGSLTNDTAEKLLKDAIQDKELFRALLLKENAPLRLKKEAERSLAEWAIGAGVVSATPESGQDQIQN
ncbi:MAG: hypothetical protein AAGA38_02995 [Pseudomonadota bacterium]